MSPHSGPIKPDIYALRSFILDQFEQFTRGDSILIYPDGQTRYVHRYNCITYHIADPNTQQARCVLNCIAYIEDDGLYPQGTERFVF
ncbi:hypothetical protein DFH28DRAFT_1127681 [Melampsora americana]|nr:hypothetical protein DFH28DRAFT_1127681 [Melampsora americana]